MLSLQGDPLHHHHHHPPLQLAPYNLDLRDESLAAAASSSSSSVSNLKRSQALNSPEGFLFVFCLFAGFSFGFLIRDFIDLGFECKFFAYILDAF